MKNLRLMAVAAFAGMLMLLASGPAQAYPDCGLDLNVSKSTLVGGGTFHFTADAGSANGDFTVTYAGQTKTASGTSISGNFGTAVVSKKSTSNVTATFANATQTCSASATITLLPKGAISGDNGDNGDNGALPNTGGSNLWILVLGGVLLVSGGGLLAARRRSTH